VWIFITLAAAVFQIARTSEQHRLRGVLDVAEAGYVRFVYAMPLAVTITTLWMLGPGELPDLGLRFWLSVSAAGVLQIVGTMSLLQSFRIRDFAVGTTYSKTEVLFVGIASAVVLGEPLGWLAWVGAVICLSGVAWLASDGSLRRLLVGGFDPAARFGVLAALTFGLTAVFIRSASNSLDGTAVDRALITLAVMLSIQTLVQGSAVVRSPTSSLRAVRGAWRQAVPVGILSLSGSAAWALAMTLENAARVRTLGQIEIVFAFAIGVLIHREAHRWDEYLASAVVTGGVTLLVIA
jgi:drug/metabolite transporter (DMT)-like permease